MDTERAPHKMTPEEFNALMKAAKERALELRREAIEDLWWHLNDNLQGLLRALRRPAQVARSNTQLEKQTCPR